MVSLLAGIVHSVVVDSVVPDWDRYIGLGSRRRDTGHETTFSFSSSSVQAEALFGMLLKYWALLRNHEGNVRGNSVLNC